MLNLLHKVVKGFNPFFIARLPTTTARLFSNKIIYIFVLKLIEMENCTLFIISMHNMTYHYVDIFLFNILIYL